MAGRWWVAAAIVVGVSTFTGPSAPVEFVDQDVLTLSAVGRNESVIRPILGEGEALVRGIDALDELGFAWSEALPDWTIEFRAGREELFGLTHTQENRIEIFVRDGQSDAFLQHVIAHEIGHAVDVSLNSTEDRERWQQARQIEDADWWPGSGATDFATGAGDFAEGFAVWLTGAEGYRSELGPPPTARQLALIEELAGQEG